MRRGASALVGVFVSSLVGLQGLTVSAHAAGPRPAPHQLPAKFGGSPIKLSASRSSRQAPALMPNSAPPCGGAWAVVPSPTNGSGGSALDATAAISGTDVWAVGAFTDPTPKKSQILTEHWDGSAWSVMTSPQLTANGSETDNGLVAVAAVSSNDVWGVGTFVNGTGIRQALVDHWNGSTWAPSSLPSEGGGDNQLFGVTAIATNDVWAVGYWRANNSSARQTMAWQWNGTAWSVSFPPNDSGSVWDNTLFGVSASATNNVFAVGQVYTGSDGGNSYPIVERWDGVGWSLALPSEVDPFQLLFDVTVQSPTSAWAVGFDDATLGAPDQTMILRWDGSSWTRVPSPNIGGTQNPNNQLFSISGSSSNLWAVGAAYGVYDANGQSSSAQTLALHWNGSSWSAAPTGDSSGYDELNGVAMVAAPDVWAVGDAFVGSVETTLTENYCVAPPTVTGLNPAAGPLAGGNQVRITGTGFTSASAVSFGAVPSSGFTIDSNTQITAVAPPQPPSTVDVVVTNPAGQSATTTSDQYTYVPPPTVVSVSPATGPIDGGTTVTITGTNFSNGAIARFGGTPAASTTVTSGTSITAVSPSHCPGTVDVTVTTPGGQSTATPADQYSFSSGASCSVVSTRQYQLSGSNGSTWTDMDSSNLAITVTPAAASIAVLSGSADLWTSSAGFNQDIGIDVNGAIAGWKESGGFAGTFSPNAAFVQATYAMTAGTTYTIRLQWKANKADPGTIWAGAGPIGTDFSPTSLAMQLVPSGSANLESVASTTQYVLKGSDGAGWYDIDASNLRLPLFTPATSGLAVITGNADLWTAAAGYNQDLGISVTDNHALPCTGGAGGIPCQPVAWKESGGFAGTFSPNAAFVQTVYPMTAGHTYDMRLQWKANKADPSSIVTGAGPIDGAFSPTRLTMLFYPSSGRTPIDAVSTRQYLMMGSNGSSWITIDSSNLTASVTPASYCLALVSGNADLWTSVAGVNQDIGLSLNGSIAAWKESGGFAGTFSPNAAYVQTLIPMAAGVSYQLQLQWKANVATPSSAAIFSGAGPIGSNYSPTRLTIQFLTCS